MNENPLLQFGIAAAIIGGIILLWRSIKPMPMQVAVNGAKQAGDQTTAYWQSEFKNIVAEGLNERIVPILDRQTEILGEMAKGINELVIIQRDERVRKAAAGGKK